MGLLKDVSEIREIESVLFDMVYRTDTYIHKDVILIPETISAIKTGKRFVIGQVVMLVTKVDATVLTTTPAIITSVKDYNLDVTKVVYEAALILGLFDTIDDITTTITIPAMSIDDKIDPIVPAAIISYIQTHAASDVDELLLKEKLGIPHIFNLSNDKLNSIF